MAASLFDGLNILLVEEETLIAMDVEQLCYEHGAARVLTLSSQRKLRPEVLETDRIDAAILDARVGEEWTTDFARHLLRRNIPFIFASGYSGSEPVFDEFSNVTVVGKPFTGAELTQALSEAVRRPRSGNG